MAGLSSLNEAARPHSIAAYLHQHLHHGVGAACLFKLQCVLLIFTPCTRVCKHGLTHRQQRQQASSCDLEWLLHAFAAHKCCSMPYNQLHSAQPQCLTESQLCSRGYKVCNAVPAEVHSLGQHCSALLCMASLTVSYACMQVRYVLQEPCSLEAHRSWLPSSQVWVSLSMSSASPASATQNRRPPFRSSRACCGCTAASSVTVPAGVRIRHCREKERQHIVDLHTHSQMQSGNPPLSEPTRRSDSSLLPTMSASCGKAWRSQRWTQLLLDVHGRSAKSHLIHGNSPSVRMPQGDCRVADGGSASLPLLNAHLLRFAQMTPSASSQQDTLRSVSAHT